MVELCGSKWVEEKYFIYVWIYVTDTNIKCSDSREIQAPWLQKVRNTLACMEVNASVKIYLRIWLIYFLLVDSKSPKAKKRVKKEDDHDYTDKKKVTIITSCMTVNELCSGSSNPSFIRTRWPEAALRALWRKSWSKRKVWPKRQRKKRTRVRRKLEREERPKRSET